MNNAPKSDPSLPTKMFQIDENYLPQTTGATKHKAGWWQANKTFQPSTSHHRPSTVNRKVMSYLFGLVALGKFGSL